MIPALLCGIGLVLGVLGWLAWRWWRAEGYSRPAMSAFRNPAVGVSVPLAPAPAAPAPAPAQEAPAKPVLATRVILTEPKIREALDPPDLEHLIAEVAKFPPLSPVVQQIVAEVNAPETNPDKIVQLVSQDPMLSMQMLRMANSAAAAQVKEITSLEQSIMLLGFDTVLTVALRGTVASLSTSPHASTFDQPGLLRHNVAAGLLAGALAKRNPRLNPGEAVTATLLHDVGKIVMAISQPRLMGKLLDFQTSQLGESRLAKEERLFGASHAVQGALLATRWQLPVPLVNAIELHHHPAVNSLASCPPRDRELTSVVFVANQLAKYACCAGDDHEIDLAPPGLLESFGLPDSYEAVLDALLPEVHVQLSALLAEMAEEGAVPEVQVPKGASGTN